MSIAMLVHQGAVFKQIEFLMTSRKIENAVLKSDITRINKLISSLHDELSDMQKTIKTCETAIAKTESET